MNGKPSPANALHTFLGVNITDPQALRALFNRKTRVRKDWPEGTDFIIPRTLYFKYLQLYDLSWQMTAALYNVLDDAEHKLVMAEAESLGYDLPDVRAFQKNLMTYKAFLEECDPYLSTPYKGDRIRMSSAVAQTLYQLTDYNCFMVAHIFDRCFNTDYMKHFGFLKQSGAAYTGAAALQQTLDVLLSMIGLKGEIDRQFDRCEIKIALKNNGPAPS